MPGSVTFRFVTNLLMPMSAPSTLRRVVVGLDVHKDTIMASVLDTSSGEILETRPFPNTPDHVIRLVGRLRAQGLEPDCCYEASSCGYVLYYQLRDLGVACAVIAPSKIPRRPGDRVKTDRRDAEKLASLYAAGLLTPIQIPDADQEKVRSLLRCRSDLVGQLVQTRHRTTRLLQARGQVFPKGRNWTLAFGRWLAKVQFEGVDQVTLTTYLHLITYLEGQIEALEAELARQAETDRFKPTVQVLSSFRGVALVTALTLACELGDIRRFESPRKLMAYVGLVTSEHSSGSTIRRGSITRTGNRHARTALVSAAWRYTHKPVRSDALRLRQADVGPAVVALAWKAQIRLHKRFHALAFRKPRPVAAVAVAREFAGFLWAAMQTLTQPTSHPVAA